MKLIVTVFIFFSFHNWLDYYHAFFLLKSVRKGFRILEDARDKWDDAYTYVSLVMPTL